MGVVRYELAATVSMAKEEANNGQDRAKDLGRDVPSRLGDLFNTC
jgi:hypothetical protein